MQHRRSHPPFLAWLFCAATTVAGLGFPILAHAGTLPSARTAPAASEPAPGNQLLNAVIDAGSRPAPAVQPTQVAMHGTYLSPHQVSLVDQGPAALVLRLWMIQNAEHEIDLESYVFRPDHTGRILLQALVAKKAQMDREGRPFRIRLLVDHRFNDEKPDSRIDPEMAQLLAASGIEVKFYNTSVVPWTMNHRNHKKLFVVDGKQFVAGGRNIEDAYFGLDAKASYVDSEVYVQGAAAGGARGSFDADWSSSLANIPGRTFNTPARLQHAQFLLTPSADLERAKNVIWAKGMAQLKPLPVYRTDSVEVVADRPGDGSQNRIATGSVLNRLSEARDHVVMENWTFVPDAQSDRVYSGLLDPSRKVDVQLLTNSFYSAHLDRAADGVDMMPLSHPGQVDLARRGMKVYSYSGKPLHEEGVNEAVSQGALWATHAKRACIDGRDCFIGSANQDPRSERHNSEFGVWINGNPQFARAVESSITRRMEDAYRVLPDGHYLSRENYKQDDGCGFAMAPAREDLERIEGLNGLWHRATRDLR